MEKGKREDLSIRTKSFSLKVIHLFTNLPKTDVAQVIGKQFLRSGTSVGAHYREAIFARSKAEFVAKIDAGLQELEETGYWLELLLDAKITTNLEHLMIERKELTAIFVTISKNTKAQM